MQYTSVNMIPFLRKILARFEGDGPIGKPDEVGWPYIDTKHLPSIGVGVQIAAWFSDVLNEFGIPQTTHLQMNSTRH